MDFSLYVVEVVCGDVVGDGVDNVFEDLFLFGVVLFAPIRQELNPCLGQENAVMQSPCRHGFFALIELWARAGKKALALGQSPHTLPSSRQPHFTQRSSITVVSSVFFPHRLVLAINAHVDLRTSFFLLLHCF